MRIVLVDPSRLVQRAMTDLIVAGGHEVVAFADGLQALEYIGQSDDVRALITSTQPHGISGIELCSAARKLSGARRAHARRVDVIDRRLLPGGRSPRQWRRRLHSQAADSG